MHYFNCSCCGYPYSGEDLTSTCPLCDTSPSELPFRDTYQEHVDFQLESQDLPDNPYNEPNSFTE